MKILHICTQMEAGGAQQAALKLANEFRTKGHDVKTCFLYIKRNSFKKNDYIFSLYDKRPSFLGFFIIFYRLIICLINNKPNAVITFGQSANVFVHIVTFLLRIPIRIATQRTPQQYYPFFARFGGFILGSLSIYTSNICVSKTVMDSFKYYPALYKKKLFIVHNGIYNSNKKNIEKNKSPNKFKMINVGRLSYPKNQILLLNIMQLLPNDYQLAIAGDGELKKMLLNETIIKKIDKNVTFLGEISQDLLKKELLTSDIFIFPSKYEAFGFALVEAMNLGLPIIASNIPSNKEILTLSDGRIAGIIIDDNSIGSYVEKIQILRNNNDLRIKLKELAILRSKDFLLEKTVKGYLNIINNNASN